MTTLFPPARNVLQVDAVGDGGDDGISASAAGHTNNGGAGGSGAHVTALIATNVGLAARRGILSV